MMSDRPSTRFYNTYTLRYYINTSIHTYPVFARRINLVQVKLMRSTPYRVWCWSWTKCPSWKPPGAIFFYKLENAWKQPPESLLERFFVVSLKMLESIPLEPSWSVFLVWPWNCLKTGSWKPWTNFLVRVEDSIFYDFQPQAEKSFQKGSRMIFFKIFNHKLKSHSRKAPGHCFLRFSASGRKVIPGRLQEVIFLNIFSPRPKSQSRKPPGGYFSKIFSHRQKSIPRVFQRVIF